MRVKFVKQAVLFTLLLQTACKSSIQESVVNIPLHSSWEFKSSRDVVWNKAEIPGDIIANLIACKLIADTQVFSFPETIEWVGKVGWEYRSVFNVKEDFLSFENIFLQFKGLGPYAKVYLNDSLLLQTNNLNGNLEIQCKKLLKPKNNLLHIFFPPSFSDSLVNKTSAHYNASLLKGLLKSGIYKPVILHGWNDVKIEDVNLSLLSLSDKEAQYNAEISVLTSKELVLNLEILVDQKYVIKLNELNLKHGLNKQIVSFNIRNPKLWWTNGLGRSHLYNVTVRLKRSSYIVDEMNTRLGVRKIELAGVKDMVYDSTFLKLNGTPLFLKGCVLMSPSVMLHRNDSAAISRLLTNVGKANINLIKVSANGYYPADIFYDLCDEKGILVWQDIITPDIDSLGKNKISGDFFYHVKRLKNHASFAFWSGNEYFSNSSALPEIIRLEENKFVFYKCKKNVLEMCPSPFQRFKIKESLNDFFITNAGDRSQIYLTQISQAEDIKLGIEAARINKPVIMGSIICQLIDYFPYGPGSVIDFRGIPKPSYYTMKNSFAPVSLVPVRKNGFIEVIGINDELKDADAILLCKLIDFKGKDYYVRQVPVQIGANSKKILLSLNENDVLKNQPRDKTCFVVQLNQPGQTLAQNILYFNEPGKIRLPQANLSYSISESSKGYNLVFRSNVLVRNLVMQTRKKEAFFSDNNMDVLPGKRYKVQVLYKGTKEELERDIELNSFNNCFLEK